jgi:tripeptidyl-peptidase-1
MHSFSHIFGALALFLSFIHVSAGISDHYEVVERLQSIPDGWEQGARPSPSMLMQFRLALRQERAAEFEQMAMNIASPGHVMYGKHMKRDEIKAFLRPSEAASDAVLSWLKTAGVSENLIEADGDWVKFITSVDRAERLLDTEFHIYHSPINGMYKIRTLEYSVPSEIHQNIQLIQPTTRFGQVKPHRSLVYGQEDFEESRYAATDCSTSVTPDCLRELYKLGDFVANPDPRNKLGISGYLDQYARYDDLDQFLQKYAPQMEDANFTVEYINGGLNNQSSNQDSVEAALDIQYGIALSYHVPTVFYSTGGRGPLLPDSSQPNASVSSNEPYLEQLHYLLDLSDDKLPAVLSTSYGENEQTLPDSYTNTTCGLFAQLGARGVSIIFSSGDEGVGGSCLTNDGTNKTRFNPIYPASCPFVTSVGGTYSINPEKAISFSSGGFSERFGRPSYQDQAVSTYLANLGDTWKDYYNPNGRGFPDVSAQSHNYVVRDHGRFVMVDGTRYVLDHPNLAQLYLTLV